MDGPRADIPPRGGRPTGEPTGGHGQPAGPAVGLWASDRDENSLHGDGALRDLLGLAPGEAIIGVDEYLARVHPDDRAEVAAVVRGGGPAGDRTIEHRIVRPDGEARWVLVRIHDEDDP